jgi:hypothetical protein
MGVKDRHPFVLLIRKALKIQIPLKIKVMMQEKRYLVLSVILRLILKGYHMQYTLLQQMLLIEMEQ